MTAALLDVNVLISLAWPNHPCHEAARAWFDGHSGPWASCHLTQAGFLRIASNPRILPGALPIRDVYRLLQAMAEHPRHVYWPEAPAPATITLFDGSNVRGHQQVTDICLLATAIHHGGSFVTFDRAIEQFAAQSAATGIVVRLNG